MRRAVSKIIPSSKFLSGSSSSETSSSALSALASNLKIDFHSVEEFYISLDDPHKPWLPGEEVSGQIILISNKNLANIVITLSLLGHVKINASSHSKLRPIKYNLFNHTIKIYGDSSSPGSDEFSNGLFKGEHRFPFIVKLPNKRIFTSIDFGKGSISYLLRASIGNSSSYTNPSPASSPNHGLGSSISNSPSTHSSPYDNNSPSSTTSHIFSKNRSLKVLHNPIYTSERIINLISPINVSTLPPPKPKRLIIRDPRNSRRLSRTQSSTSTINTINTINSYSTYSSTNSEDGNAYVPNGINRVGSSGIPTPANGNLQVGTPTPEPVKSETIKVSLEIPQRGYIRGELIPLKICINHLKKVQDLNGIIVTFVRVCRIDKPDGSFESFRKDLQQSIIPLYVDPVTFKSEINSSVRVPADAFPTIVGCPLVSFQYFIEVLINLSGKSLTLENDDKVHPTHHRASFDDVDNHAGSQSEILANGNDSYKFNFNFNSTVSSLHHQKERSGFVNTDKYKRSKKFLQLTTEIIIGTHRGATDAPEQTNSPLSQENQAISSNTQETTPGPSAIPLPISESLGGSQDGSPANVSQSSRSPRPSTAQSPDQAPLVSESSCRSPGVATGSSPGPCYIGAIPESAEVSNFRTPPYVECQSNNAPPAAASSIPNYDELAYMHHASGQMLDPNSAASGPLSEKDRMRLHESSLLPSAPPELDDCEDVISPVIDDILESPETTPGPDNGSTPTIEAGANQGTSSPPKSALASGEITPSEAMDATHQLQFFTFQSPLNTISEADHPANNDSDDDLYHDPTPAASDDQYSAIDFVPKYETANKDKLLVEGAAVGTGTHDSQPEH